MLGMTMVIDDVLTFDDVEGALMDAMEYLTRMPDRERGWLSAASRSSMPEVIRATWLGDYGDGDAVPRGGGLSRADVAHVERWLTGERALVLAVPAAHRRLVGLVLRHKRESEGGGFAWADVWRVFGDRAVTSDALRKRYERAIRKVAVAANGPARRAG
jgi:hypothetical protein